MQKIIPHLWFDHQAKEAAEFYTGIFPDSRITNTVTLHNTPSGDTEIVSFQIWNQEFMSISAGPLFTFNPSVSFMVNFDPLFFGGSSEANKKDARDKLDKIWNALADGGKVLMPLQQYPFSKHYGWVQDKYGLSWQLMLTNPDGEPRPPIIPSIMFAGNKAGQAEAAINFYTSVFKNAKVGAMYRYGNEQQHDKPDSIMYADFVLEKSWFAAMDSGFQHGFDFNEAISFMVNCKDQAEIDYYWDKLTADPKSEQCGWLKDKFGLSWQITPTSMNDMMSNGTPEQVDRVTQAFLPMKKLELAPLEKAYRG